MKFADTDWKLAKDFYVWESVASKVPKVGDTVNGWKLFAAWVNENDWLKGYAGKCEACGKIRHYIGVRACRDRTAKKCEKCNKLGGIDSPNYGHGLVNKYSTKSEMKKLIEKHGAENIRFVVRRFRGMVNRGTSEAHPGICSEWIEPKKGFINFFTDCSCIPGFFDSSLVIDRIDTLGKYELSNVRFTTQKMNNNNKINTNWVVMENGGKISLAAWCELRGFSRSFCKNKISRLYKNGHRTEKEILFALYS